LASADTVFGPTETILSIDSLASLVGAHLVAWQPPPEPHPHPCEDPPVDCVGVVAPHRHLHPRRCGRGGHIPLPPRHIHTPSQRSGAEQVPGNPARLGEITQHDYNVTSGLRRRRVVAIDRWLRWRGFTSTGTGVGIHPAGVDIHPTDIGDHPTHASRTRPRLFGGLALLLQP
jgi:hypothetical protein